VAFARSRGSIGDQEFEAGFLSRESSPVHRWGTGGSNLFYLFKINTSTPVCCNSAAISSGRRFGR
jgi:hypothetical protein